MNTWRLGLAFWFLYAGYECVRSPGAILLQTHWGSAGLGWGTAGVPLGTIAVVILYNFLLDRFGAKRTLAFCSLGAAILLTLATWAIGQGALGWIYVLFVFREAYVVLVTEQLWSLANSIYPVETAKRQIGWLMALGTLGAITGGWLLAARPLGFRTETLPYLAALSLVGTCALAWPCFRGARVEDDDGHHRGFFAGLTAGWMEVRQSRILGFLSAIVLLSQGVATTIGFLYQAELTSTFPNPEDQSAFSGKVIILMSAIGFLAQAVATPWLLKRMRPAMLLMLVPIANLIAAAVAFVSPTLATAAGFLMLHKLLDYSLFRAGKEVLYIPLSFTARYRSKELIDVFFYRASKGLTSVVSLALQSLWAGATLIHGALGIVFALGWTAATGRALLQKSYDSPPPSMRS